jgi:hypothetical protein
MKRDGASLSPRYSPQKSLPSLIFGSGSARVIQKSFNRFGHNRYDLVFLLLSLQSSSLTGDR